MFLRSEAGLWLPDLDKDFTAFVKTICMKADGLCHGSVFMELEGIVFLDGIDAVIGIYKAMAEAVLDVRQSEGIY